MSDLHDLRDLVGDDVPEQELERMARADRLLRETPAPPEVPDSLTARVLAVPSAPSRFARHRPLAWIAAAAALAAATFGVGFWVGQPAGERKGDQVMLSATPAAPRSARMVLTVLPADDAGNWPMVAEASGLPPLPAHGYYEVWMTRNGRAVALCGRFAVDASGSAHEVWLNAPYDLRDYQRWVVSAVVPGRPRSPWLLDGAVDAT
jgi:hypothetical protein